MLGSEPLTETRFQIVSSLLVKLRSLSIITPSGGGTRPIVGCRFETLILSWAETLILMKK